MKSYTVTLDHEQVVSTLCALKDSLQMTTNELNNITRHLKDDPDDPEMMRCESYYEYKIKGLVACYELLMSTRSNASEQVDLSEFNSHGRATIIERINEMSQLYEYVCSEDLIKSELERKNKRIGGIENVRNG